MHEDLKADLKRRAKEAGKPLWIYIRLVLGLSDPSA